MPLVSIIVPVYNSSKYLKKCVESVLTQTYSNLEIILVDDGSLDNSPALCDELSQMNSNIVVIHKTNGGASDARNHGLLVAKGEFIMYLDSDDYWCEDINLEKLVNIFIENYNKFDFIIFNFYDYFQSYDKIRKRFSYPISITEGTDKYTKFERFADIGYFPMSPWTKIIKKEFLINNKLFFIQGTIGEDIPWFIDLVNKCSDFKVINEYIVYYVKQIQGTITSSFSYKKYDNLILIVENCVQKAQSSQYDAKLLKSIYSFMAYEYAILIGYLAYIENNKLNKYLSWLEQYKWLFKYGNNRKVIMTKLCVTILGFRITAYILQFYIRKFVNKTNV